MHYRIEVSQTRKGFIRINFPGWVIELEAVRHVGPVWQVEVGNLRGGHEGSVAVRADSAGDAVWRVAQAAVRAVAELTDSPLEGEIKAESEESLTNLS